MIKLIIFDMDGTLIDTDDILIATWNELFSLYKNGEVFDSKKIEEYSGPTLEYAVNDAFKDYKDKDFIYKEYRKRTKKYYESLLKAFPDTVETIKYFYENNIKLCVLTAKTLEMTKYCLTKIGLSSYFLDLITCDSNFKRKPDPEGINYLKEKYNLNNDEIMMVGDTTYDALAGINANVKTCILTMRKRKDIDKIKVDYKLDSYKKLKEIIDKENGIN